MWDCEVHGRQTDHSSKYCRVLHPELFNDKKNQMNKPNCRPLHDSPKDSQRQMEANMTKTAEMKFE